MPHEESRDPALEAKTWLAKNKPILTGVLLLLTFMAGYAPGYLQAQTDCPSFEHLPRLRNPFTEKTATDDSGVLNELQELPVKIRAATAAANNGRQPDGTRSQ